MCEWGNDTEITLCKPQPISGRTKVKVDSCIAPLVNLMNLYGIHTMGCCCGHGKACGWITIEQEGKLVDIILMKVKLK